MAVHQRNTLAIHPDVGKKSRQLDILLLAGTRRQQFAIPVVVPEYPNHPDRDPSQERDNEWRDVIPGMEHHVNLLLDKRLHRAPDVGEVIVGVPDDANLHLMPHILNIGRTT
ncbi:MAG: hypothetical protein A4E36_01168 [Methanoregulaceae archaeon PtaB.Bin009]|nr:MAG: hypothetical protein A4E36_01168 [Methanoregulaceae archaeon PtaB.Bin009]OPY38632.1 MAG: hypothetical protein A4E41_01914 [Methanoregulaceae archaeon PtaU1.Bin066]